MPYTVELHQIHPYIDSEFSGDVTADEVRDMNQEILKILSASDAKLSLLTDLTKVKSQPNRIAEIWQSARPVAQHEKLNWWVIVGINNPILDFLIGMLTKLAKIQYHEFKTRDEGLAFLESMNATSSYN